MNTKEEKRCGYVAVVGRPNVGKSTLLNHLLKQKICITSRKPQTTRHQQLGILTSGANQIIFVDTPGIHKAQKKYLNKYMNFIEVKNPEAEVLDHLIFTKDIGMKGRIYIGEE